MEVTKINNYMKMFSSLDMESKIELMRRFSENVSVTFNSTQNKKRELLDKLSGSWSNIDDKLIEDIYQSRTVSNREINF